MTFRDAGTGELLWGVEAEGDIGRGLIMDIDPNYQGAEAWTGVPLSDNDLDTGAAQGEQIRENAVDSMNFEIWWTGDPHWELMDHDFLGGDAGYGVGWIKK